MTGVFVPAGTPKAIVDLLQKEIAAIVNAPDMKAKLLEVGVEAEGNSQADFAAYVKRRSRQVAQGDRGRADREDLENVRSGSNLSAAHSRASGNQNLPL